MKLLPLLFLVALTPCVAKKPKHVDAITQAEIVSGCVRVWDIHSHKLSILSGIWSYEPGLTASVRNDCSSAVMVILTVAYFDAAGLQLGSGIEVVTVAAGANIIVQHRASLDGIEAGRLRLAKIINSNVTPLQ